MCLYKNKYCIESIHLKNEIEEETKKLSKELNINLQDGFNFKLEFSEVFDNRVSVRILIK